MAMNRFLLSAAIASTLTAGCGRAVLHTAGTSSDKPAAATQQKAKPASRDKNAATTVERSEALRNAGDYVVYRFSGSFRSAPLTLTERVVSTGPIEIVLDYVLEEGNAREELRVRFKNDPSGQGEVLGVARVKEGVETAADLDAYDHLMAKTILTADENEEVLGANPLKVDIAGKSIACEETRYRVRVGSKEAILKTVASEKFPWRDIAGEIMTIEGDTIYRAEIVDMGDAQSTPQVARSEVDP
jgi:hypothetical protein